MTQKRFLVILAAITILLAALYIHGQGFDANGGRLGTTTNGTGAPSTCPVGAVYIDNSTGQIWTSKNGVCWLDGAPSASVVMTLASACPTGFTEVAALNGTMPYGTIAANSDVGTTGGANSVTPTGSNATASFTPAGTVAAPTFTGTPFTSVINHTHTVNVTYNVQGGTTAATTGTHVMTSTATGGSARAPTSGDVVSATTANPSGGVSSITPAGTNTAPAFTGTAGTIPAETWTGNSLDNRSAFVKVIFCSKN